MKLEEIQNGLSYAGNTRARNFDSRANAANNDCISSPNCKPVNRELAMAKVSLNTASKMLSLKTYPKADNFSSNTNNI